MFFGWGPQIIRVIVTVTGAAIPPATAAVAFRVIAGFNLATQRCHLPPPGIYEPVADLKIGICQSVLKGAVSIEYR